MKIKNIILLITLFLNGVATADVSDRIIHSYSPGLSYPFVQIPLKTGGAGSTSDVLQVFMNKDRSYECSLSSKNRQASSSVLFFHISLANPNQIAVFGTRNGMDYPAMTNAVGAFALDDFELEKTRFSIVAQLTGLHTIYLDEKSSSTDSQFVSFKCRETTLYGSYNRFFAQSAILEIRNASSKAIPVLVSVVNAGGNIVVNNQESLVAANTRTDIIFANLPANDYGQIIVTHKAPYGALSGYVSEYDVGDGGEIILKRERKLRTTSISNVSTN